MAQINVKLWIHIPVALIADSANTNHYLEINGRLGLKRF